MRAGNKFGKGKPRLKAIGEMQRALAEAAKPEDVAKALDTIRKIMRDKTAKACDRLAAALHLLNRLCGLPDNSTMAAKLDELLAELHELKGALR
ncbi:MAG TPA: hypothetical protein VL992_01000 [Tepidisphaeraceae bacterium]|nr:hypothetical protein [Tepidisphaeraceae bacterium]